MPGNASPSPQRYNVKRLFEQKSELKRPRPECTFGIPYEAYRNVVIGSLNFLGQRRYFSPKQTKLSIICDHVRQNDLMPDTREQ